MFDAENLPLKHLRPEKTHRRSNLGTVDSWKPISDKFRFTTANSFVYKKMKWFFTSKKYPKNMGTTQWSSPTNQKNQGTKLTILRRHVKNTGFYFLTKPKAKKNDMTSYYV